ncbi:MAG TPA: hypothetical protein VFU14_09470, partial [Acidimicrobiales bacterium]|nr:hypothetical protein [Acidimicrobiales bacterium]
HGWEVVAPGDLWAQLRRDLGRSNMTARRAAAVRRDVPWRRYYSTRNLIHITRLYGSIGAAAIATARYGLMRALVDSARARSLRAVLPPLRGAIDAWCGRMGRTVAPS